MDNHRGLAHRSAGFSTQTPGSQAAWKFLTFSHPLNAKTESNRRRVRSHATRHHHQQTRALKEQGCRLLRQDEIEIDVTTLLPQPTPNTDNRETGVVEIASEVLYQPHQQLTASPGFGRFDPFFNPPIQMHYGEYELCDHLFDQSCVMFRTMQNIGFLTRARMTVAFCQLLAMSSWHLTHLNQKRPRNEYLKLSLSATQELQNQINSPLYCCTDDAISAVLVFICCANLMHDTTAFIIHRNGLQQMLNLRGGIQTLDESTRLWIMLHWADVNGSCFQDISPLFPTPVHFLPDSSRKGMSLLSFENSVLSASDMTNKICLALRHLHDTIDVELHRQEFWQDTIFPGMHITPILGQLLALGSITSQRTDKTTIIVESFRLSAILYTCALRARFGVDTVHLEPVYARKLHLILISQWSGHDISSTLFGWILAIAYTSICGIEQKTFFRRALLDHMKTLAIVDYTEFEKRLESIVWDNNLRPAQSHALRQLFI